MSENLIEVHESVWWLIVQSNKWLYILWLWPVILLKLIDVIWLDELNYWLCVMSFWVYFFSSSGFCMFSFCPLLPLRGASLKINLVGATSSLLLSQFIRLTFFLLWNPLYSQADDDCCNSCEDVREAYRKKGWAVSNPDLIDQVCQDEGSYLSLQFWSCFQVCSSIWR